MPVDAAKIKSLSVDLLACLGDCYSYTKDKIALSEIVGHLNALESGFPDLIHSYSWFDLKRKAVIQCGMSILFRHMKLDHCTAMCPKELESLLPINFDSSSYKLEIIALFMTHQRFCDQTEYLEDFESSKVQAMNTLL